jgi:uncharacterized protein
MQFVDTNIFLRHLTNDDPVKAKACFALFQRAQRKEVALTTSESVVAEIVYVLSSSKQIYRLNPEEIRARLYPLLSIPGLKVSHRKVFLRALDLFTAYNLDFEDALSVAHMEQQKIPELYSYDEGFDQIENISRLQPT